jgi:hypothetical protein
VLQQSPAVIVERRRERAPMPEPQGLALRDDGYWITFRGVPMLYALDRATWSLTEIARLTGTAWGLVAIGDEVAAVCAREPDDCRSIHRFDAVGREIAAPVPCPSDTGSYLAYDGRELYVSQWYERRIFRLRDDGSFEQVARSPRGICGIAAVDGRLAVLNTADEETNEYFLTMLDPRDPAAKPLDVARVPFAARSLTRAGDGYLTNHRERGEIVTFDVP